MVSLEVDVTRWKKMDFMLNVFQNKHKQANRVTLMFVSFIDVNVNVSMMFYVLCVDIIYKNKHQS